MGTHDATDKRSRENQRRKKQQMNTYLEVGNTRFESREEATKQIAKWRADTAAFSVCEVANTEVTRKTAKGNIITETVRGSLDKVPRIISVRQLDPTYIVVDVKRERDYGLPWYQHLTRADAEQQRAERQSEADR